MLEPPGSVLRHKSVVVTSAYNLQWHLTPEPALKPLAPFSYCILTSLHSSVSHMIYAEFQEQCSMSAHANPSVQNARPEALSLDTASSCPILSA